MKRGVDLAVVILNLVALTGAVGGTQLALLVHAGSMEPVVRGEVWAERGELATRERTHQDACNGGLAGQKTLTRSPT